MPSRSVQFCRKMGIAILGIIENIEQAFLPLLRFGDRCCSVRTVARASPRGRERPFLGSIPSGWEMRPEHRSRRPRGYRPTVAEGMAVSAGWIEGRIMMDDKTRLTWRTLGRERKSNEGPSSISAR